MVRFTMTRFTDEDLDYLTSVPSFGMAVSIVDKGGTLGSLKELAAVTKAVTSGAANYPNNDLVRIVHSELHSPEAVEARYERNRNAEPKQKTSDVNVVINAAFEKVRVINAILEAKATPQEAEEYRRWILEVAQAGAEASKEGGVLGIGGVKVSEAEQHYLDNLANELFSSRG